MKLLLLICLLLSGFSNCNRFATEGFNTYFWTSTGGIRMYLYIDGENKGELPYLSAAPDCDNEASKRGALKIYLPSGNYGIDVKDDQQRQLFAEQLKIWKRGGNVSLGTTRPVEDGGGSRRNFKDHCLIEELYYNFPELNTPDK